MYCTSCGAEVADGAAFCARCGRAMAVATATPVAMTRPGIITLLAVLQFIAAVAFLPIGVISTVVVSLDSERDPMAIAASAILIVVGVMTLMCGIGLWRLRPYGRILQMIGAVIGLLAIPLGTIVSIAILIYLNKPGIKLLFSGRAPETLTPEERANVAAMQKASGGVIAAVVIAAILILSVPAIGIIAAIAVPGLLRARIAGNEASAIGTLRAFQSAEAAFTQASGGSYGSPECLVTPASCLPHHTGGRFIGGEFASEFRKTGYDFHFEPGPAADATGQIKGFALYAVPASVSTGTRLFCVDDRGAIVSERATVLSVVMQPACPSDWREVQ
jgi:type IV pilus assembly protein PilA